MNHVWIGLKSVYNYLSKLNYETFTDVIKTKIGLFFSGFLGGGGSLSAILFLDASPDQLATGIIIIKTVGAIMVAFITGAATALGKGWIDDRRKQKDKDKKRDDLENGHKQIWGKNGTHN